MFANLIESQSHGKEFRRRGQFVIATAAAYGLLILAGGIISIFAYDARVEAKTDDLELINWVPPVRVIDHDRPAIRRPAANNNERTALRPVRPILYESPSNPINPPVAISTAPNPIPPATRDTIIGNYVADPLVPAGASTCITCSGSSAPPIIPVDSTAPAPVPTPVKPQIQKMTSTMLISKIISLPQPPYPQMAKQIGIHGAVPVQILIDEGGKVISAQAVSGHPMLTTAAKDAAMRARFTPTILNGQPVKVQGVITYNFVLQ